MNVTLETMHRVALPTIRVLSPPRSMGPWIDGMVVLFALFSAVALSSEPVGSGDYGQWLMTSRFLLGEDLPAYRDFDGVPPFVPATIALVSATLEDPLWAIEAVRALLFVALVLAFYAAGSCFARSRLIGAGTAVIAFVAMDEFRLLFAFGGLPQAAGLAFGLLSATSLLAAFQGGRGERLWWILASICWSLGITAHVGTLVAFTPALVLMTVALVLAGERRPLRAWVSSVGPAALAAFPAVGYWLTILVPANQEYATNPASWDYRGPAKMLSELIDDPLTLVAACTGLICMVLAPLVTRDRETRMALLASAALMAALTIVVSGNVMAGTSTDYPRFNPVLLVPPLLALAAGARACFERYADCRPLAMPSRALPAAALFLGTALIPFGTGTFNGEVSGYALQDSDGLAQLAQWIEENVDNDETVLVSGAREGKWIEGLSGRDALFPAEVRFSFRPEHWNRSVAAESLVRSTSSLVNGYSLVRFASAQESPHGDVPRELSVAINHDGEYVDLARVPAALSRVMGPNGVLASLEALRARSVDYWESNDGVGLRATWTGSRDGHPLNYIRSVWIEKDSTTINIVDEVHTTASVSGMTMVIAGGSRPTLVQRDIEPPAAVLKFEEWGSRSPRLVIGTASPSGRIAPAPGGVEVSIEGSRLHVQIVGLTSGDPIADLALLDPAILVRRYNIGAAVLKRDPAYFERERRLHLLGFEVVREVEGYALLTRKAAGSGDARPK